MAQALVFVATTLLLVGLFLRPGFSLQLLWRGLVPVLALTLLLAPHVWRNICPLATAEMAWRDSAVGRAMPAARQPLLGVIAIAIFLVAISVRHTVFEPSGSASAILIGGAMLVAGTIGRRGQRKAGFCNAICPVGPVERLLGQYAQINPGNPRCDPCTLCTPRGCLDLALDKTPAQLLGRSRRSSGWLWRPTGAFGAAFPGIVLGWGIAGIADFGVGATVGAIGAGAIVVWLLALGAARLGAPSARVLRVTALAGAAIYAGFAWPVAVATWRQMLAG